MKALVSGGTGFLGLKLAKALLCKGIAVRLLVRDRKKHENRLNVEVVEGDLANEASLLRACEGMNYVFHTAGVISYNPAKQDLMVRTNVLGMRMLAEAALRQGVQRFVHTSSTAAIGINHNPAVQLNENSPFNAGELGLAYFNTKYEAELELQKVVARGLDAIILNPGSLLGPGDTRRYEKGYPGLIYKYNPPLLFHGGINFVDIDDIVDAHIAALTKGRKGERYILGGENLSFADLIRRTNQIIGRKSPRFYVPQFCMGALAKALGLLNRFGVDLHMTPELVRQVTSWYLYVDSSKAKLELGYNPKPIDAAILNTIAWLKDLGRL